MRWWTWTSVLAAVGSPGCDLAVTGKDGDEQCLDDFLADLGEDRGSLEAEAEQRGMDASDLLAELVEGATSVADVLIDCTAREQLAELSSKTGGKGYTVGEAEEIPDQAIAYNRQVEAETVDLVILVDVTGSMSDDIDAVRIRLDDIIDALPARQVRLSVASYRDKNVDEPWFASNANGLVSPDDEEIGRFLDGAQAMGGGDLPESLYDGIARVVEEVGWSSEARLVVAITDAGPLTGEASDHGLAEVVDLCVAEQVAVVTILVGIAG